MKLSKLEFEVLQLVCAADTATAPGIHEVMARQRDIAYSTVKTIFDRLEKKGAIRRTSKVGRTSVYEPIVSEESVQKSLFHEFVQSIFPKDKLPLLSTLVRETDLSDADIKYLKDLLNQKQKGKQ
jgi:BlaI family penicillinase repressor